jgi:hypothetical protein
MKTLPLKEPINTIDQINFSSSKVVFEGTAPTDDDYGNTIGDIAERFFAFNCQLKKLNGDFFLFANILFRSQMALKKLPG